MSTQNKHPVVLVLHGMVDPEDPKGRIIKEVKLEIKHNIPVGTLVEMDDGCRLWVVWHGHDCDGTPLYCLCSDRDDNVMHDPKRYNYKWDSGYPEESLTVVAGVNRA